MSDIDYHAEPDRPSGADRQLLAWALAYARPHVAALAGCLLLLLGAAALDLAQPFLIKLAIDRAMAPAAGATPALRAALSAQLAPLAWTYVAVVAGASLLQYLQGLWLGLTGQRIILAVRRDLFDHLEAQGLGFFDQQPAGRLVTRVTNDVEALNEMYTSVLVNLFRDLFVIAGAVVLLLRLDARLALVAFAVMPLVFLTALVFQRFSRRAWRRTRLELARINARLAETFSGVRVIQLFGREARASQEFRAINDGYFAATIDVIRVFAVFGPVLNLLTSLALAGVIWYGGGLVLGATMSLGTLYAFTAYLRRLFDPLNGLAEKYNILQSALASAERITALLAVEPALRDREDAAVAVLPSPTGAGRAPGATGGPTRAEPAAAIPAVEFDDVWFAYGGEDWVLRGLSFRVMPGETVGFVGHTGAGKTTIMSLLPRFYDVARGRVRVNGRDVRDWPQRALRRQVGSVMQDVFLFAGDIAGNITLGDPRLGPADAERAAELVGAAPFVRRLPGGFDAPVVERGQSLSAGERQLIAFARAMAHDPDVLILDEATASVDTETEEALQQAIRSVARGRTTLIVAHRLATIKDADRIYVMDRGRIVEQGAHADLLAAGGVYARLWSLQFAGLEG
ncbi:MAG: ABC transporter ATP-binding protein [Caldilineae bacterium]|nr:ABC transporter ATP-binding protein [Caldilineae bacterium]